jgi:hypothetical protein
MNSIKNKKDWKTVLFMSILLLLMGCAGYGAGGVYSSNNQSEIGGYIFGNSEYAETTVSYAANLSDNDTQSFGAGFSIKVPLSFWKIALFPLANIEYQRILGGTETVRNLGWVRFGGGLDFSVTDAFFVRGEGMYAPDLFSFLPKIDLIGLNPATGYTIRIGLGWRPGVPITSNRKEKTANTNREQTNREKTDMVRTEKSEKPAAGSDRYRGDTTVPIPYKIEGNSTSSWLIFQPSIPNDVPQDIYKKLWNINQKTIKAGKYDFNAFNYNTAQFITYDESAMSDNFTFAGVCMNYADYFIFVLKHDSVLLELYNKGIITEKTSPSHKWIEYRTENNRYIIDPTWCDWDYVGQPVGIYANNAEFAEACRTSYNRVNLIEAKSKSWFFRNVKTLTEEFDRRAHGL